MAQYKFPNVGDTSAHQFTAADAAAVAATLVTEDGFLSALISRNYEQDLMQGGGKGRTVNIKIPATLIARERAIDDKQTGIVVDEIRESTAAVTLGTHAYSAVSLSEGDLNFNLQDFSSQVLSVQAAAVADSIEYRVGEAMAGIPLETDAGVTAYDPAAPVRTFVALRKALRQRQVPQTGLNVVVGTNVYADLINSQSLLDASQSGSTDALREGGVGRVAGFQVVESTRIGDDDIVAFHRDAFTLAVRAPLPVLGADNDAVSSGGFPLRALRDYDPTVMSARSIVSTFVGVAALPLFQVTRDYAAATATVTELANGGAIRIDTAGAGGAGA